MKMNLEILDLAQALANHASGRQNVVATNIANADTPGYQAHDVVAFAESYAKAGDDFAQLATRPTHIHADPSSANSTIQTVIDRAEQSPNGNSVSLEQEMIKAVELQHQYDMALGVYRKSMDILRISLGK